jgi:hypothetical protein
VVEEDRETTPGEESTRSTGLVIHINRTPVLTLWAAVVAERLGYEPDTALTLGKAVSALYAQIKVRDDPVAGEEAIPLMGRVIGLLRTAEGMRAVNRSRTIEPEDVIRYLEAKFGAQLPVVRRSLETLAASYPAEQLASCAYRLYQRFKPTTPAGWAGWGAVGEMDLERMWELTR